ncbi:MAG TPA: DUF4835 family protein [Bacteroidetes bacterium]|nr:DUF4835 family protein [Bacteroidota bacterium]
MARRWILILLLLFSFSVSRAAAQRLVATVRVDLERLPQENQNKLRGLNRIIEAYINQREWGPDDYNYDVPLDFDIYFEEAFAISFEDRYKARLVISNRSNFQHTDRRWEFPLAPGVQLVYSESFDPFRSLIDYYVYMVLGYEYDKVKKFGGTPYFETARQISQSARFSSRYFLGWDKREEWVEAQLKKENERVRYLNFLYYTGEWLFYTERDPETAKQYLLYAAKQLDKVPKDKLKRFFDLNYFNYANALAEYKEYTALSKLASLDPDHADLYQKLLKKR